MQASAVPEQVAHLFKQGGQSAVPISYVPFTHEHYGLFCILVAKQVLQFDSTNEHVAH